MRLSFSLSRCHTAPSLEVEKRVFNPMAQLIRFFILFTLFKTVLLWWNNRFHPSLFFGMFYGLDKHGIGIIAFVGKQVFSAGRAYSNESSNESSLNRAGCLFTITTCLATTLPSPSACACTLCHHGPDRPAIRFSQTPFTDKGVFVLSPLLCGTCPDGCQPRSLHGGEPCP